MNYADIHWCDFPEPDRRRPAILLTRQNAPANLTTVTVVPITSTIRRSPAFVYLSIEDGLLQDCAANCDMLTTVPKSAIGEFIASLSPEKLGAVHEAICFALSIE